MACVMTDQEAQRSRTERLDVSKDVIWPVRQPAIQTATSPRVNSYRLGFSPW